MIVFSVRIRTTPKGKRELLKTVVPMIGPVLYQSSCVKFNIYQDTEDPEILMLEQRWENREDFNRHVRSADFKRLLAVMELATEKPEVSFYEVDKSQGLKGIERIREQSGF